MAVADGAGIHRTALGVFAGAAVKGMGAAVAKGAGVGGGVQDGGLPLDHLQPRGALAGERGNGFQQGTGIGVLRLGKQVLDGGLFHHLPAIHDHHTVGDGGNHAKVMGDPDDRHAQLLAQLFDQFQNLRLNGHIKGGGRFIGNQHIGVARQRNRDHHALAHTAGKLMGIVVDPGRGIGNTNQFQQFGGADAGLRAGQAHVADQRLHDLIADGEHRVQAGHRVLKDETDPRAAHIAQVVVADLEQVAVAQHDLTTADFGRGRRQKPDQRHHGHRFARAAFADNAQKFTTPQMEADRVDGMNLAAAGAENGFQAPYIKDRCAPIGHRTLPNFCYYCCSWPGDLLPP